MCNEPTKLCLFGLDHAKTVVGSWADDYNHARLHSSLGYLTPATCAAHLTARRASNRDWMKVSGGPMKIYNQVAASFISALTAISPRRNGVSPKGYLKTAAAQT